MVNQFVMTTVELFEIFFTVPVRDDNSRIIWDIL